ncbi:MAG: rcc01693 family protein [Pseudomonadota bacterium]|nr:rcc01693 family protein [Pseudomonadota bacterium]
MSDGSREMIDWPSLMRLGLGALRLPPDVFWGMTPRELRAAADPDGGAKPVKPMARIDLAALAARFPDAPKRESEA